MWIKFLIYLTLLQGTHHYIMYEDHGNSILISNYSTLLLCCWLLIMMIVLCHYTRLNTWRWVFKSSVVIYFIHLHITIQEAPEHIFVLLLYFSCVKLVRWISCILLSYQTLQHVLCTILGKSPQTNPIIGRIECKAGHGAGRPTQKMVCFYFDFFSIKKCDHGLTKPPV